MHAKLCKYGESNRLRLFPFWMSRFYLISSSEFQTFYFFFLVFWSFMSMGSARLEIQIFFTTFIITYWVSKVSYQVVIGETLLLHEFIINTNFILCTRLDCSVHILRYQVFFFFSLHVNNNITWFYYAGTKNTVYILFTHC